MQLGLPLPPPRVLRLLQPPGGGQKAPWHAHWQAGQRALVEREPLLRGHVLQRQQLLLLQVLLLLEPHVLLQGGLVGPGGGRCHQLQAPHQPQHPRLLLQLGLLQDLLLVLQQEPLVRQKTNCVCRLDRRAIPIRVRQQ